MMKLLPRLKAATHSIRVNRLRSFLTMLGIIIGVGSVIAMISIGEGPRISIQEQINALGSNMIMIRPGTASSGGISAGAGSRASLTLKDVEALEARRPSDLAVSPVVQVNAQVIAGRTIGGRGSAGFPPPI